jgi:hypothetical protein
MRDTVGVPGLIGLVVLVVWVVGWIVFGMHEGGWHFLFPIGVVLLLAQVVRRVDAAS